MTIPSRSASTCPRIAVKGVRSSCDTDMRKERLSCSASASLATMRRKRSLSREISSLALRLGDLDVVAPGRDVLRRAREGEHRLGEAAREPPEQHRGEPDPDGEREREPFEQGDPLLAELGDRLGDDEPAERLGSPRELDRLRGGEQQAARLRAA